MGCQRRRARRSQRSTPSFYKQTCRRLLPDRMLYRPMADSAQLESCARITLSKNKQRDIWDAKRELADVRKRKAHAIRVAWRIIHTWVKAQLALVEINMVTIPQVFLSYAVMRD